MANAARWSQLVAARIRKSIEDSDIPEYRIADLTGIPNTTFRRRVQGIDPWSLTQLAAVADVLGLDVSALTSVADERPEAS